MKNSNDTIGNRTHGLPECSAVPQPTVPPRVLHYLSNRKGKSLIKALEIVDTWESF